MMDKTVDPLPSKSKTLSPLTPKTTLARVIVSKRSFNEYKDDFRFLKQKKKQVYSGPTATNEEKLKINQKAVEFTLTDKTTGRSFHYDPHQSSPVCLVITPGLKKDKPGRCTRVSSQSIG